MRKLQERGIAPIVLLGIVAVFVAVGAGVYYISAPNSAERAGGSAADDSVQQEVLDMTAQLQSALRSGGIHPDTKATAVARIEALRVRGASEAEVEALLDLISQIPVVGAERNSPPPPQPSPPTPKQPTPVAPPAIAPPTQVEQPPPQPPPPPQVLTPVASCVSNPNPVFTRHVTDLSKVERIKPPPNIAQPSGDLKTHSYLETGGKRVPVYAPVDMTLIGGAHYEGGPYMFDFRVSCEVKLRFAHISEPINEIRALFPATPAPADDSRNQQIPHELSFKAGELIAYTVGTSPGAGNWDFGVYNSTKPNKYASDPKYGQSDIWSTAVCPYEYFSDELKAIYRAKLDFSGYGQGLKPDGESFCAGL
ncbi:hypothetical protein HY418_02545 [Candidatus Kaiserbacteria bacterium]|nr:hypothetical protein [Candidatus Kaiserbacteria bacterium]